MDEYFHVRGALTEADIADGKPTHFFTSVLNNVITGIRRSCEYFSVIAPENSGKTTFAFQLISKIERTQIQNRLIPVYVDLHLTKGSGSQGIVASIPKLIFGSLKKKIDEGSIEDVPRLRSFKHETQYDLEESLIGVCNAIGCDNSLVLVLDEIDRVDEESRSNLLMLLRSIYSRRNNTSLRNLSIVLLSSTRLVFECNGATSPFNIALEEFLQDLTFEEVTQLLKETTADTVFTKEAVRYLHSLTGGQIAMVQEICSRTIQQTNTKEIFVDDIANTVADFFVHQPNAVSHMVSGTISKDARLLLERLIGWEPILPFASRPGVQELLRLGIIKRCSVSNRFDFRSPLIRLFFTSTFGDLASQPTALNDKEKLLIEIPQVKSLLMRNSLYENAREGVLSNSGIAKGFESVFDLYDNCTVEVQRVLDASPPQLDHVGLQAQFRSVCKIGDMEAPTAVEILRLVSKIFAAWILVEILGDNET